MVGSEDHGGACARACAGCVSGKLRGSNSSYLYVSYIADSHDVGISHHLLSALGIRQVQ